jgi:outer membrane protein OmpA-like peptidoglycan-associated protein
MKNYLLFILFLTLFQSIHSQKSASLDKVHVLIPPIYQDVKDFSEGMAAVKNENKWGFVNKYGEIIIDLKYQDAKIFSEGLAAVKLSGKWGFIDAIGKVVIPFRYKEVKDFKEGIAAVNLDGFWGGVNQKGEEVIPFDYDFIHSFSEGLAVVVKGEYVQDAGQIYKEGENHSFVNKSGKETIMMFERKVLPFQEDLAPVKEGGKWGYIDRNKKIGGISVQFDSVRGFSENYAAVYSRGRWGFINKKGGFIVEAAYDKVGDFSEGLANARFHGKWGFIDGSENKKIDFTYDSTAAFSEELALVRLNEKYGFINKSNEKVIPFKYKEARSFSNGAAAFQDNGRWGFITLGSKKPKLIHGKLTHEVNGKQLPLSNATVKLSNHSDSSVTDNNGMFKLHTVAFNENLFLQVNANGGEKKVALFTVENEKIGDFTEESISTFEYRFLKADLPKLFVPEEEEVEMVFKGRLLTTEKGKKIPLVNAKVKLSCSDETTVTDHNGDFKLNIESYIEEVSLEVETSDKLADVILATHLGKEIAPMNMISKSKFEYKLLKTELPKLLVPEEEEVTPIIRGKLLTEKDNVMHPVVNATVQLSNSSEIATTDMYGDFELKTNDAKELTTLKVITESEISNVIVATQGGHQIGVMTTIEGNTFEYKLLKADFKVLLEIQEEEDVEMVFKNSEKSQNVMISQPVNYAFGKYDLEASSYPTLDKVVKILKENPKVRLEIISHTDAVGAESYNLLLSKKRAETVMSYLISNGINKKRLTAIGKGESQIRNRCVDNVSCSELEHEFNRRTEFNFIMN